MLTEILIWWILPTLLVLLILLQLYIGILMVMSFSMRFLTKERHLTKRNN
jgi:hypothetical protein